MKIKQIITIILVIAVIIVVIQNSAKVSLTILFWEIEMSKIIFYPLLFAAGFIVGLLSGMGKTRKDEKEKTGVIREYR
ncbi:MAG: LapA family protein [Candidatus Celaenobacter antarcticus]|nr:LapA family protein [Candidatus Celaenobacter antarcticus]